MLPATDINVSVAFCSLAGGIILVPTRSDLAALATQRPAPAGGGRNDLPSMTGRSLVPPWDLAVVLGGLWAFVLLEGADLKHCISRH